MYFPKPLSILKVLERKLRERVENVVIFARFQRQNPQKRADRTFAVYPFCGSVPEIVVETKALFRYKKGQYPNTSSVEMRFIGPIFSRTSMSRFFSSPSTMYR